MQIAIHNALRNYAWKELYNHSRHLEQELDAACTGDPTVNWPPSKPGGPYALAFSGGMRSFLANFHSWQVNFIDASGGGVDLFFHVWGDDMIDGMTWWNSLTFLRCKVSDDDDEEKRNIEEV